MTRSLSKLKSTSPIAPQQKLSAFRSRFGEPHLLLAYHSALLLVITPDLMYRLWATFYQDSHGVPLNIPWIAVSDFLLNVPNREMGKESYRLDAAMRRNLLAQLRQHPRLGKQRLQEVAAFILTHIQPQLTSPNPKIRHAAEAQRWTALAYTQPEFAAQELATALANLSSPHDITEWRRLTTLIETLSTELADFQPLLTYATAMKNFICFTWHDAEATANQLRPVLDATHQLQVARVNLPIPEAVQASLPRLHPVKVSQEKTPWLIGFSMAALIIAMGLGINQFNGLMKSRSPSLRNPIATRSTKPVLSRKKMSMNSSADRFTSKESTTGFDIDVASYIANKLDIDLDILSKDSQLPRFTMDEMPYDMYSNPDFDFSDSYYEYRNRILVEKGVDIATEQDLIGKKVGVVVGSLEEQYLRFRNKQNNGKIQIVFLVSGQVVDITQAFRTKRIDAAIVSSRDSNFSVTKNSLERNAEFNFIDNSESRTKFVIIFGKDSEHVAEFNRVIREMKQNGELERLRQKWFGQ